MERATDKHPTGGSGDDQPEADPQVKAPKINFRRILRGGWHLLIKIIGPGLTIVALGLSIFQLILAMQAEKASEDNAEKARQDTQKIADQYKEIAASVSTKYVGVFPDNMRTIIDLIKTTQSSLTVITDVAAYGHFSSPRKSTEYASALRELSSPDRKISVRFLCYNSDATRKYLRNQFGITNFADFKKKEEEKFTIYSSLHPGNVPENENELFKQIDEAGIDLLKVLYDHHAKVSITSKDLPVFVWIVDGKEAVFSFYNYGQSPREDSFVTRDPRFIERLTKMAEDAFVESQNYAPKNH